MNTVECVVAEMSSPEGSKKREIRSLPEIVNAVECVVAEMSSPEGSKKREIRSLPEIVNAVECVVAEVASPVGSRIAEIRSLPDSEGECGTTAGGLESTRGCDTGGRRFGIDAGNCQAML